MINNASRKQDLEKQDKTNTQINRRKGIIKLEN